jgi:hypothetical protein
MNNCIILHHGKINHNLVLTVNVHRHFKTIDDCLFLINISYELHDSIVALKNFTMHAIQDEVVGPNIVKNELNTYDEYALGQIFDILKRDGVI